jgi:hypothetical protein
MKCVALALALALTALLGACSQRVPAGADGAPQTPMAGSYDPAANCPNASADTQRLLDAVHGYCLLYPAGYTAQTVSEEETVIHSGSLMSVEPRVYIEVELAEGRTAEDVAQAIFAGISEAQSALPGYKAEGAPVSIGGVDGILIDNLPGQDIQRVVLFAQAGRLFRLTFVPLDGDAENRARLETLYTTVVESFTWLLQ